MEAIEQGIFTKTTKTRIVELEEKKEELIEKIAKEKLKKPILTEPQIREWLLQFIEEGVKIEEQKKILISGFVNSVYVFEDKILIVFNTKNNDKEVTFTDIKGSELKTFTSPHQTAHSERFFCFICNFSAQRHKYVVENSFTL